MYITFICSYLTLKVLYKSINSFTCLYCRDEVSSLVLDTEEEIFEGVLLNMFVSF